MSYLPSREQGGMRRFRYLEGLDNSMQLHLLIRGGLVVIDGMCVLNYTYQERHGLSL